MNVSQAVVLVVVSVGFGYYLLHPLWHQRRKLNYLEIGAGLLAGVLLMGAYDRLRAKSHYECTQEVNTGEGTECVGKYVRVAGPDYSGAFMAFLFGALALRISTMSKVEQP